MKRNRVMMKHFALDWQLKAAKKDVVRDLASLGTFSNVKASLKKT
jgi:hypothetical protein